MKTPKPSILLLFVLMTLAVVALSVRHAFTPRTEPDTSPDTTAEHRIDPDPTTALPSVPQRTIDAGHHDLDPRADGWDSEVDADKAKKQLAGFLDLATRSATVAPETLKGVSTNVQYNALRPPKLIEVFNDASISVREQGDLHSPLPHNGTAGLAEALSHFAAPLRACDTFHTHVKVIRIETAANIVTTHALIESGGRTADTSIGQHANWTCQWQRDGKALRLHAIQSEHYREVTASGPQGVWFSDCTQAILGENASFEKQLAPGLNHWLQRIERTQGMEWVARWGAAVGDVNGDGRDDLYVCQPGGLPNRLYVQQADGTALDQSAAAGVDWLDTTSSALFIDVDNDGDQDLVVATSQGLVVMENDAAGQFSVRATLPTPDTDVHSLSAVDYDNDGDLDLYICLNFANRAALRNETPVGFVYHDANDGGANVLFRNDISPSDTEWTFTDVTRETGLDVNNRRHSLAASWEDYDNDGDQDLYVANDYGRNCLYRNENGRFTDVARASGVVDYGSGMSVSWGDANRDGWMDLYVGNMFSSAGNRITPQSAFASGADQEVRSVYNRFAKGNTLFTGDAAGTFQDVGADAGVEMGRWAWSSLFADLNNDGWQDLLVANGYITTEDTGDL